MARTKVTEGKSTKSTSKSQTRSQTPSKRVRIAEPSEEETETPLVRRPRTGASKSILKKQDKGKAPMEDTSSQPEPTPTHHHSDSDTESGSPNVASSSRRKGSRKGKKASEIPQAPEGYNTGTIMINAPFKFKDRELCPAVYVDLDHISGLLGQDVKEYLEYYNNLISLQTPFNPDMVRVFYNNMVEKNVIGNKKRVIEYGLQTIMRGSRINISAELLNVYLGTGGHDKTLKNLGNAEIFEALRPGEEFQEGQSIRFEPSAMPPLQRTIHYVYSRCMVNKGRNYTHLSLMDYQILGSIMKKEKRNIGQMIFLEMQKLVQSKSPKMYLPYPSLVSRIMDLHHVWYLLPDQIPMTPQQFTATHFHRMNIEIINPEPEAAPRRRRRVTTATSRGQDEAQSSAAAQQPYSAPSFSQAALQTFMQSEFRRMGEEFTTAFHAETQNHIQSVFQSSLDAAVATLVQSFDSFQVSVSHDLTSLSNSVLSLDSRVGTIEQYIRGSQTPQPAPPPGSEPSSSERLFAQIDFSASAQPVDPVQAPPPETSAPQPFPYPDLPPSSPPHPL